MNTVIAADDSLGARELFFNQMRDVVSLHGANKRLENDSSDRFKPGSFQSSDSQVKWPRD
jgi:hypothetical protein